jgi:type II secretory pathway pseudopilin PulG
VRRHEVMRIRPEAKHTGGFAFIAALMVMLVIAILLMAILTMAMSARLLAGSRQEYTQAIYLAEAGINALISDWRARGPSNPPAYPYEGELENGHGTGNYHVEWTNYPGRDDWVVVTSVGTVNTGLVGTVYNVSRTVEVRLDSDGDWAWNHVYYSDTDLGGQGPPEYATINGNGDVQIGDETGAPADFADNEHGPGGGETLPSPMWDKWHDWVRHDLSAEWDPETETWQQVPRDENSDGTPDPRWVDQATLDGCPTTDVDMTDSQNSNRHMFWYGAGSAEEHSAHAAASHSQYDQNDFMPDWYGVNNPDAYICNSSNKPFTVTFTSKANEPQHYYGNYYVHGDVEIKNKAQIHGTIIATGDITFSGVANASIEPEALDPLAPCDERVYYPSLIAGRDVLVRDQGVGEIDDSRERLRVSGIIWAGSSYTGQASNVEGCVVSPSVTLGGNFLTRYGIYSIDGCDYGPGDSPPPWFREPDRGEMNPVPRTWRER